ncbi:hypothetical protein EYC80_007657 [Monilinia laxa]|uniref:Uncharacterized protein n=1 Tax=Monilinia laxa TaxID=61186 RepID=A0A5N6JWK8_MONLA|nr:hypothetical protein EYC80_007657 [Monilinia laxa]
MAIPIRGRDYPQWNSVVLDQEYPRWNNLFDTVNFDDAGSLRRIFHAISTAQTFHPFNLGLVESVKLSDAETIAVRDFSYAFNRNHLCRDMVLHLILFSRHNDEDFTLEKEAKFYTEMLKKTNLSPVNQPNTYLQVRREFRRLAPDLEGLDEDKAAREISRWASWRINAVPVSTDSAKKNGDLGQKDGLVHAQGMDFNENDNGDVSAKDEEEADTIEAARILMSMSTQGIPDSSFVTSAPDV